MNWLKILFPVAMLSLSAISSRADDAYEPNDSMAAAYSLGAAGTYLFDIAGYGQPRDQDWYKITVSPSLERVQVECLFRHISGDMDIALMNASGTVLARSSSSAPGIDSEFIDRVVPGPGTYYILVEGAYGNGTTNKYNLWWNDVWHQDDSFEDNDTQATSIGFSRMYWLTEFDSAGAVQTDEDWYLINVRSGQERVRVDCLFTHSEGNIAIELFDATAARLAISDGNVDNERIDCIVPRPDWYYIRVRHSSYGFGMGNTYDLWWGPPDDAYEENDSRETAYDFSNEGTWLSSIGGAGVQVDSDWYAINVSPGFLRVHVDCRFTHADGDIDIQLYDSSGVYLTQSAGNDDNEYIDYHVPSAGTYYILVQYEDKGNAYDLWWDDFADSTYYRDADGDGYGNPNISMVETSPPLGFVSNGSDCNDSNPAIHPGAAELCDGLDNDCDGSYDEGCPSPPPSKATNPSPVNGAMDRDRNVNLSWANGGGAATYDVYFNGQYKITQSSTTYDPGTLEYSMTYTWRIDANNSGGTTTGDDWSFTTENEPPQPPSKATNPSPASGLTNRDRTVDLSWVNGGGATSYDVYFGTDSSPDNTEFKGNQWDSYYDPGNLSYNTTYYWKINSKNDAGSTTGDTWSFKTMREPPPSLSMTPASRSVGSTAGTTTFSVTNTGGGSMSYATGVSDTWLEITSGGSGINGGTIGISYGANTNSSARTGTVTVTASGADGSPSIKTIIQAGVKAPGCVLSWIRLAYESLNIPEEAQAGVSAIAAGLDHTMALKNGKVLAWGFDQYNAPEEAQSGVSAIAAGVQHDVALKNGQVLAWGNNGAGQCNVPEEAQTGVTAIAAGSRHTVALRDGQVLAWGAVGVDYGQCSIPLEAESQVSAISAGSGNTVALKNGKVLVWGDNSYGQCDVPAEALSGVTAIAACSAHIVALKNGRVLVWGNNSYGQCDVPADALSGVTAIAACSAHIVALKNGRVLVWGNNSYGQCDVPVEAQSGITAIAGFDHTVVIYNPSNVPPTLISLPESRAVESMAGTVSFNISEASNGPMTYSATEFEPWLKIQSGGSGGNAGTITIAYDVNSGRQGRTGTVFVAAANASTSYWSVTLCQAGNTIKPAVGAMPAKRFVGSMGGLATFAITNLGVGEMAYNAEESETWLNIQSGGNGINTGSIVVSYDTNYGSTTRTGIVALSSAGAYESPMFLQIVQAIRAIPEGCVLSWGYNVDGLGDIPLDAQSGVSAISAGWYHAMALKNGQVLAWGANLEWSNVGQCNVPDEAQSGVDAIAAGIAHSVALKDGKVLAWGYNNARQCIVPWAAQSEVTAIAAGMFHTVALKNGKVLAWGSNTYGQCNVPAEAQSGVTAIAAGSSHAVALNNGKVLAWGYNWAGQCNVPAEAQSGVSAIASGSSHTVALKNGRVLAWGCNDEGQCNVPAVAQSGVTAIAAGDNYTLALKNGRVLLWGYEGYDGQTLNAYVVPENAQSGVAAIAAGFYDPLALKCNSQLSVIPAVKDVQGLAGSSVLVVTNTGWATMPYTASENETWLNIDEGESGTNTGIIAFSYNANPNTTARTGTITVAAMGAIDSPKSVKIVQSGMPIISVSPSSFNYSSIGANGQAISVLANTAWTANSYADWLTIVSGGSGIGNETIFFNIAPNASAIRSGKIAISGGGITRYVVVNQWPASAHPLLSADGDFDGDFNADLTVFHPAGGNWHLRFSTGTGWTLPFSWSTAVPVPADYDGDGLADIAIYHPAAGNWYLLESSTGQSRQIQFGWSATVPVPGDYDGDGKADFAVYHSAAGRWYFICTTAGRYSVQWGWSAVIPVPADYDGDGKTDIAVYHPATGNWYVFQSSTGRMLLKQWGWNQAIPVPADYDGDGSADIAVFHRAPANWYVLYSGGGSLTKQFGWWETIPVAADYDGDGATDLAVYHPATGNWYILKSTTGGTVVKNWGWSATKPTLLYPMIHSWFRLP